MYETATTAGFNAKTYIKDTTDNTNEISVSTADGTSSTAKAKNYTFIYNLTLTINKKTMSQEEFKDKFDVTYLNELPYNGTSQRPDVTIKDKVTGLTLTTNDVIATGDQIKDVDNVEHTITITASETSNYSGSFAVSWKLVPRQVTIQTSQVQGTYTGEKFEYSYTSDNNTELYTEVANIVSGEKITGKLRTIDSNVGSYTYKTGAENNTIEIVEGPVFEEGAKAINYDVSYDSILIIGKKSIEDLIKDSSYEITNPVFNGSEQVPTFKLKIGANVVDPSQYILDITAQRDVDVEEDALGYDISIRPSETSILSGGEITISDC